MACVFFKIHQVTQKIKIISDIFHKNNEIYYTIKKTS